MAWDDVWGGVAAVATAVSTGILVVSRGSRERGRISRDLAIAEKLPEGAAKESLVAHAESLTQQLVAREQGAYTDKMETSWFAGFVAAMGSLILLPFVLDRWDWLPAETLVVVPPAMGVLAGTVTYIVLRLRTTP